MITNIILFALTILCTIWLESVLTQYYAFELLMIGFLVIFAILFSAAEYNKVTWAKKAIILYFAISLINMGWLFIVTDLFMAFAAGCIVNLIGLLSAVYLLDNNSTERLYAELGVPTLDGKQLGSDNKGADSKILSSKIGSRLKDQPAATTARISSTLSTSKNAASTQGTKVNVPLQLETYPSDDEANEANRSQFVSIAGYTSKSKKDEPLYVEPVTWVHPDDLIADVASRGSKIAKSKNSVKTKRTVKPSMKSAKKSANKKTASTKKKAGKK